MSELSQRLFENREKERGICTPTSDRGKRLGVEYVSACAGIAFVSLYHRWHDVLF